MTIPFSRHIRIILGLVLVWRLILALVSIIADKFIPLAFTDRYLGGGKIFHFTDPGLFGWANFDGEHYLSIAIVGYHSLEQAFFPFFPFIISFPEKFITSGYFDQLLFTTIWGLFISYVCLVLGLILIWEIIYFQTKKITLAYLTVLLMLVFPTSFFFGALYTESLFLLLSSASFYFYQRKMYWFAGIMGFLASLTRVYGIVLAIALFADWLINIRKYSKLIPLLLIPLGLFFYMFYLWQTVGDPLAFYNLQTQVGPQHQSGIVLLPQVYYRYLKIFWTLNGFNWLVPTLVLEFFVGILFFILPLWGYFKSKIPLYFLLYALIGFLMPSVQGSFSSVPRYILVLFPSFWVLAEILLKCNNWVRLSVISIFIILMLGECGLFLRGYWVA